MSKRSDGAASAASIEDAFCEWRGKRLNHDKYICEMEKIA